MEDRGHPLSLIMQDTNIDTPWGLAKAYVTETFAYMLENDGWNADGSESRQFNRIPFSDYAIKDSAGNKWTPYQPQNSPYKVQTAPTMYRNGMRSLAIPAPLLAIPASKQPFQCPVLQYVQCIVSNTRPRTVNAR